MSHQFPPKAPLVTQACPDALLPRPLCLQANGTGLPLEPAQIGLKKRGVQRGVHEDRKTGNGVRGGTRVRSLSMYVRFEMALRRQDSVDVKEERRKVDEAMREL